MQQSDDDDYSKIFNHKLYSLNIYTAIENSNIPTGPTVQTNQTFGSKITPKSVVESVCGKLKSLQVSDSLRNRHRNQRSLHDGSKTHHKTDSINKPIYAASKFETQDISASQLVKAIDYAEELHSVASKGYTQAFDESFEVENNRVLNVSDLEKADATDATNSPEFFVNMVETTYELETKLDEKVDKIEEVFSSVFKNINAISTVTETTTNEAENINDNNIDDKDINHRTNTDVSNKVHIEANSIESSASCDNKILNQTYCIINEYKPDFSISKHIFEVNDKKDKKETSEGTQMQNIVLINLTKADITPSPVSIRQDRVLSPHIVCNLDDFERFEQLAVSITETNSIEKKPNENLSQILSSLQNGDVPRYKNTEDIKATPNSLSDSLSDSDKAQLEFILNNNDNSNDISLSPVFPVKTMTVKFDKTLESYSDMELTCKDTAANIISTSNMFDLNIEINNIDVKDVAVSEKVDEFLEDDILFSSDEENEYIHKELNELPLTCALETSFYTNKSDVLDKTMFVGFQTAGNKSISIRTDSFSKAQNMMDEIDCNLGPSLLELVDRCEKSAIKNKTTDFEGDNTDDIATSSVKIPEELINKSDSNYSNNVKNNGNFIGFKTASNKNINLSEKSRQRILKVFQDIDLGDDFSNGENDSYNANFDCGLVIENIEKTSNESTHSSNNLFTEIEFTDTEMYVLDEAEKFKVIANNNIEQSNMAGFKTASNKAISVSAKALQMSKKVFENIDNTEVAVNLVLDPETQTTSDDHVFKKPDSPMLKAKNSLGFKTAVLKTLNIVNNAVNADHLVTNENEQLKHENKKGSSSELFSGFKTASNKKVIISNKALEQSNKLFQDILINIEKPFILDEQTNLENITSNICFKTASNQPIRISNETIDRCKKLFENIDASDEKIPQNNIKDNAHAIIEDFIDSNDLKNDSTKNRSFVGFQTASNKIINISKQSLENTKHIFDDNKEPEVKSKEAVPYNNLNESNTDNKINETPKLIGFQTANNRKINISKESLEKTKRIFNNIDDMETDHINNKCFGKEEDLFAGNNKNNMESFPTVVIADEDLKQRDKDNTVVGNKSLKNMEQINKDNSLKRNFQSFQTASNKKVKVSNEAIAKTKDIFNDICIQEKIEACDESIMSFKGFQTASKKNIMVSKDALAKTINIFQDISQNNKSDIKSNSLKNSEFAGFQTGCKKIIPNKPVSGKALKISKNMFDDITDTENVNSNTANLKPSQSFAFCFQNANQKEIQVSQKAVDMIRKDAINLESRFQTPEKVKVKEVNSLLDTQAISYFENTMFTEDFCKDKTPIQAKRSGSPILSCPRAKKRKSFQTPYKTDNAEKTTKAVDRVKEVTANAKYEFNNKSYKKNTTMNLKILHKLEDESKDPLTIDKKITDINYETILKFEFEGERNDLSILKFKGILTIVDIKTLFMESIDKKIVPEGWFENHSKLIMWKLLSYEIKFPRIMRKVCSAKNVIEQLKYRYDRELYNVERPALRKVLEKDELSSRCIVLCVVNVIQDGEIVERITDINKTIELTVTDGWYCVRATIDKMLTKLVYDGKIVVGCKVITHGAELVNCDQGISPLEHKNMSEVRLKIFGNSTRLARWHTKLGFFASAAILNRLSNVKVNGGKVSKLRLFVTRVYPMLYVEKFDDGSTVTRSERLEQKYQNKYEMERQNLMEKLYEEIERDLTDEDSQDSTDYKEWTNKGKSLDSGSQIAKAMKQCKDPVEFRSNLTESQVQLLNEYTNQHRDRILQQIQSKIREKMEKSGSNCIRNVVPLLKVRVADIREKNGALDVCHGYISIWRPNEAVAEIIKEGEWIDVLNALPTAYRSQEIQFTAGRQTIFNKITPKLDEKITLHAKQLLRYYKEIKQLVKYPNNQLDYNEIDTLGIVTEIDPPNSIFENSGRQFQNVYLADLEKNMISVNFWGGIKKFGYENILDTGQFIYGRNLQKRVGNTRKSIPQFRVTEFTIFTKTPKSSLLRNLIEGFVKQFRNVNRKQFCDECSFIRRKNESNKYSLNTESISPFRMNTSDYNLSKNKQYFESPLALNNRKEDDFRLTGLDFESTFKQTDTQNISPELLKRKRIAQAKIAKLKMYGEPPPLSPIHILHKSKNATAAFKSPLINDPNKSIPTVSPKTTTKKLPLVENRPSSPVFNFNTTCTKKFLKPVRLNFNVNDSNNSCVDHFAEDFDSSPPLSLD